MTKIAIQMTYTANANDFIELPEGKTWDDVEDYFVKWSMLYIRFKGGEDYQGFDCDGELSPDNIDYKRPDRVAVFATDKDGNADYDVLLAEQDRG